MKSEIRWSQMYYYIILESFFSGLLFLYFFLQSSRLPVYFLLVKYYIIFSRTVVTYFKTSLMSLNVGLLLGSNDQHWDIRLYNLGGHLGGRASRSPFSILPITSLFLTPWNGLTPIISTSHMHTPNIQTSLAVVNRLKLIDSGDIHLIGNLPLDAL